MEKVIFYLYHNGEYIKQDPDFAFEEEATENSILYIPNEKMKNRIENLYNADFVRVGWNIAKLDRSGNYPIMFWRPLDSYLNILETKITNLSEERDRITEVILSEP